MRALTPLLILFTTSAFAVHPDSKPNPTLGKSEFTVSTETQETAPSEPLPFAPPDRNWYVEVKPGYYYFTTPLMRRFYENGGFTIRGEAGYRFYNPLVLWMDAGYFHKDGWVIDGYESTCLTLGTLTIGLKTLFYFHPRVAVYLGAGPRLFLMEITNESPYVPGKDNEIGVGGGFTAGFWFFPFAKANNLFIDLFADYSAKDMGLEEDEVSSQTYNVDLSGLTAGLGVGFRF